jgi:ATP-dependent HslUV protease ATP-binding subunit HslU
MRNNTSMTPKEIVEELNKYIVGQDDAKKAVAIALRNRWRRLQLSPELQEDIIPKNIIMMGPTGVGKTEIARRLAKLANAPFFKVEASKFTEVGYVGRDVESMIRDLMEIAVTMVKKEKKDEIKDEARKSAAAKVANLLRKDNNDIDDVPTSDSFYVVNDEKPRKTRKKLVDEILDGKHDDKDVTITIEIQAMPMMNILGPQGSDNMMDDMGLNIGEMIGNMLPKNKKDKTMKVKDALNVLTKEESNKMVDMESVKKDAKYNVENNGIIFLDEIDKIASVGGGHGPNVSRDGVQRDILPIVEGSTVNTKYGMIKTDHILFIAAGAFHMSKPSDLIPELQGRFPIRVELNSLNADDFVKILKEPKNSLIKQYEAMLETENLKLRFTDGAIKEISVIASKVNTKMENIGARRLHTILEKVLEELSFNASDLEENDFVVDAKYVKKHLNEIVEDQDLSRYVL